MGQILMFFINPLKFLCEMVLEPSISFRISSVWASTCTAECPIGTKRESGLRSADLPAAMAEAREDEAASPPPPLNQQVSSTIIILYPLLSRCAYVDRLIVKSLPPLTYLSSLPPSSSPWKTRRRSNNMASATSHPSGWRTFLG